MGVDILVKTHEKIGKPEAAAAQQTPVSRTTASPVPTPAPAPSSSTPTTSTPAQGQNNRPAPANQANQRNTFPIEGLSPYQNNWTIRARVTNKSDIRTWSNARGDGKLFSITFADHSGIIRGTAFNAAVDELYDKFEVDKSYYITKARVQLAKKQFNTVSNEYELALERHTQVEEVSTRII